MNEELFAPLTFGEEIPVSQAKTELMNLLGLAEDAVMERFGFLDSFEGKIRFELDPESDLMFYTVGVVGEGEEFRYICRMDKSEFGIEVVPHTAPEEDQGPERGKWQEDLYGEPPKT